MSEWPYIARFVNLNLNGSLEFSEELSVKIFIKSGYKTMQSFGHFITHETDE